RRAQRQPREFAHAAQRRGEAGALLPHLPHDHRHRDHPAPRREQQEPRKGHQARDERDQGLVFAALPHPHRDDRRPRSPGLPPARPGRKPWGSRTAIISVGVRKSSEYEPLISFIACLMPFSRFLLLATRCRMISVSVVVWKMGKKCPCFSTSLRSVCEFTRLPLCATAIMQK